MTFHAACHNQPEIINDSPTRQILITTSMKHNVWNTTYIASMWLLLLLVLLQRACKWQGVAMYMSEWRCKWWCIYASCVVTNQLWNIGRDPGKKNKKIPYFVQAQVLRLKESISLPLSNPVRVIFNPCLKRIIIDWVISLLFAILKAQNLKFTPCYRFPSPLSIKGSDCPL